MNDLDELVGECPSMLGLRRRIQSLLQRQTITRNQRGQSRLWGYGISGDLPIVLVRIRSQTTYYVLTRIKSICKVWLDRQRARQVA